MSEDHVVVNLRSIARFQITKSQWVLATLALVSILALGASSLTQSNETIKQTAMLSDVETPAASIIFTQRETLVYATRVAQWSNGGTTRREVQIARNLLAQRLAVIDTSGRSMGSRAKNSYWRALRASDVIVAAAPVGILPESMHKSVNAEMSPLIDDILAEARKLVVSYQRSTDEATKADIRQAAKRDQLSLILFYLSLFFSGLFLLFNVLTNFRSYRKAGRILDEEQQRLQSTLAELQRAQSTVTELKNLNDAKNAFIATVNHELRTPLTSIIGYIDIIRDEYETASKDGITPYLDVLDRNAQILLTLVESMLTLSRIDSDQPDLNYERVWLNEVIDNAIFTMKPQALKSGVAIIFDDQDEYYVQGDSGQLIQVFINLLGNAVKFSPKESSITISLSSTQGADGNYYANIAIADSGIGIPSEDIEYLFTRFFRAKNAVSEHFQGTGLGLSIVSQVIERHGGSIKVESIEGSGTTFTLEIPISLTEEERMILDRRRDVLLRAITSLEGATPETIQAIAHEIGGALGFYGFARVGTSLIDYSRTLSSESSPSTEQFLNSHDLYLNELRGELADIEGEQNG